MKFILLVMRMQKCQHLKNNCAEVVGRRLSEQNLILPLAVAYKFLLPLIIVYSQFFFLFFGIVYALLFISA